jgi:metal-sulfur cluster biosynthetic enzyme
LAWNRVGLKLLPRLRAAANQNVTVEVRLEATTHGVAADALAKDLRRALEDLNLADRVRIESEPE